MMRTEVEGCSTKRGLSGSYRRNMLSSGSEQSQSLDGDADADTCLMGLECCGGTCCCGRRDGGRMIGVGAGTPPEAGFFRVAFAVADVVGEVKFCLVICELTFVSRQG